MKYPIHIAFCVNDLYLEYIRVTVRSIIETHPHDQVTVHILSDNISDGARLRFLNEFSYARYTHIEFYNVDDSPLDDLKAWSKYTWYRLLLPSVLPDDVHRVLYLDADTLVTRNLGDLFDTDMSYKAVAGVIDPMTFDTETYERCGYEPSKQYICAGVMLINLDYWREYDLQAEMIAWGLENVDIRFHDQDCINYICRDEKVLLPLRYGVIDTLFVCDDLYEPERLDEIQEAIDHPAIIHYAGKAPWLRDVGIHPLSEQWHRYNSMLKRHVRRSYKSKGLLKAKIIAHGLLNPGFERRDVTINQIKQRIIDIKLKNDE